MLKTNGNVVRDVALATLFLTVLGTIKFEINELSFNEVRTDVLTDSNCRKPWLLTSLASYKNCDLVKTPPSYHLPSPLSSPLLSSSGNLGWPPPGLLKQYFFLVYCRILNILTNFELDLGD